MAIRATMAALIQRTSRLLGDPTNATWSTQDVQDGLDRYQETTYLTLVQIHPQIPGPGAAVVYKVYTAPVGDWEAGATIQTADYTVLMEGTDYTADYQKGQWTLTASSYPPIWLGGSTYDIYATAADLLEYHAATAGVLQAVDFSEDGQSIKASQMLPNLLRLVTTYRAKARPQVGTLRSGYAPQPIYPRQGRRIPREYS